MRLGVEDVRGILRKTDYRCHICRGRLRLEGYGEGGEHGWEVEHSKPRARGGSDYFRNLFPAHESCNRSKGTRTSRAARREYGYSGAPLSKEKKAAIRRRNALSGAAVLGLLGRVIWGGPGMVIGALVGGILGHGESPEGQ
ncbi:MAG: HNH endonuclease [Planctomycetes bacterium]|nr:HNH endonuclease [Planctomycetota bacterium]